MKILKSTNNAPLGGMDLGKIVLNVNGEDSEGIWVRKSGDKCYLQNHALAFMPYPSWGLELPNESTVDVASIRGNSPEETVLVLHREAYEALTDFINANDEFDIAAYYEHLKTVKPKKEEEE